MSRIRTFLLVVGLLVAAVASAQTAGAQGPTSRGRAIVDVSVEEAVAANEPVEAMVLLDDAEVRALEEARVNASVPLHLADLADYNQRMLDREALLQPLKSSVRAAVGGPDIQFLTEYSVLPILHVRILSPSALARLAGHARVLSIDENRANSTMLSQSLPLIRQPTAAAAGYRGAGTTVAVLDTGTDYTRAAFGSCAAPGGACKVVYAQDFTPSDDGARDTGSFHGTNVSGTVLGVAPDAKIAALDVFRPDNLAYSSDITSAINWCIAQKATYNIASINMSLGGNRYYAALAPTDSFGTTVQNAVNSGITVVAASGNDGYTDSISWPAAYSNIVSVGAVYDSNIGSYSGSCIDATTAADKVTCFSNSASFLSLLAPGSRILAADISMSGTSQATPHVAGAAAVVRAAYPGDSVATLINRLKQAPLVPDERNGISKRRIDLVDATTGTSPSPALSVSRSGNGTVTSNVPGINCGSTCSATYDPGTIVVLTATPPAGSVFGGWGGNCSGTGTCTVSMSVDRSVSATFGVPMSNGQLVSNLTGALRSEQYFVVTVPSGATNLVIRISGGTGDADLHVRRATLAYWECIPYLDGNNETCSFATPATGNYYVMIRGWSAYSGVSLQVTYAGGGADTQPDPFSFTPQTNVGLGVTVTSNTITPSGYDAAAPVSVANGTYSIGCTGSFTGSAGSINPGQSVCVRHTASATPISTVTTTLTIGGVNGSFSSTTTNQQPLFRAYLSSSGSDANPCTLAAPCRLLPAALNAVASGGEIWMLNSGNYNSATANISKSVSILAVPGVVGSLVATGGPALSITASGLNVALRNLVIVPLAGGGGTHGIVMTGDSTLTIEDSLIANLPQNGVQLAGAGTLKVANSTLRNNAGAAFSLAGGRAAISSTQMLANGNGVLAVLPAAATMSAAISDSVISDGFYGVRAQTAAAGATARIQVTRSTIERAQRALQSDTNGNGAASVVVSGSMIVHSNYAWYREGTGATISSLGNNHFTDNTTSFGSLTPIGPQ